MQITMTQMQAHAIAVIAQHWSNKRSHNSTSRHVLLEEVDGHLRAVASDGTKLIMADFFDIKTQVGFYRQVIACEKIKAFARNVKPSKSDRESEVTFDFKPDSIEIKTASFATTIDTAPDGQRWSDYRQLMSEKVEFGEFAMAPALLESIAAFPKQLGITKSEIRSVSWVFRGGKGLSPTFWDLSLPADCGLGITEFKAILMPKRR